MKSYIVALIVAVALILGFSGYKAYKHQKSLSYQTKMVSMIQEVLKLALIDIQVTQLFEIKKDSLRMMSIPIPLTSQKSVIVAEGKATLGYDLTLATFHFDENRKKLGVKLPDPSVLSLDLSYRFVFENDTFLNRITPEDRSETLEKIKEEIRSKIVSDRYKGNLHERIAAMVGEISKKSDLQIELEN